jgi:signal transduction histidine kinase
MEERVRIRVLGETRVYQHKAILVNWEGRTKACLHVFSDVSSIQELEEDRAISKYTKIMLASVSHEFRTPVNAI